MYKLSDKLLILKKYQGNYTKRAQKLQLIFIQNIYFITNFHWFFTK